MRFSSSVDALSQENKNLRFTVVLLSSCLIGLTLGVLLLYDRAPVLVESTNHGVEVLRVVPLKRSEQDVEEALRFMLRARFSSSAKAPEIFLTARQAELRADEQRELESRHIVQEVIFRKAHITKNEALVEFDRVLAVGDLRSALRTTVQVAFEEVDPNELNPYGLVLAMASPVPEKEVGK